MGMDERVTVGLGGGRKQGGEGRGGRQGWRVGGGGRVSRSPAGADGGLRTSAARRLEAAEVQQ